MTDTSTPADPARFTLEHNQRLSRSFLWQVQKRFYHLHGIDSWRKGIVPHYVTSNPRIASAYAQVVFGYLRDCFTATLQPGRLDQRPSLDKKQPIYIIELGAGSGRFAYHFLRAFTQLHQHSILGSIPVQYVLTDVEPYNLQFIQSHPQFQPYIRSGQFDTAPFDVAQPSHLVLNHSGVALAAGQDANPIVLIANYVFDSIPQDAFHIEAGQLYENCVSVTSSQQESDLANPDLLKRIQYAYSRRPISTEYYSDPQSNRILQSYQQRLDHTNITFPKAALDCIQYFQRMGSDRVLLLSGDKGYSREDELQDLSEPIMAFQGSFSMMVNFHAIAQYVTGQGGYALHTSYRHSSLCISAFVLGEHTQGIVETRQAFRQAIENGGPDDFFSMFRSIAKQMDSFDVDQMLAFLRLSGYDHVILQSCLESLMYRLGSCPVYLKDDWYEAIVNVWDAYFHLGEEQDLAAQLGSLLYQMGFYRQALTFFQRSQQLYGPKPGNTYCAGMCHYRLRNLIAAQQCMVDVLALNPSFAGAMDWRIRIESEFIRGSS